MTFNISNIFRSDTELPVWALNTLTKIRLYKALIRPILEYPAIPMCLASPSDYKVMQQFQNKCIRKLIKGDPDYAHKTIEELHQELKIEAINVRLHRLANKTWDRLCNIDNPTYEQTTAEDNDPTKRDHNWWPRISPFVNQDTPEPLYYAIH